MELLRRPVLDLTADPAGQAALLCRGATAAPEGALAKKLAEGRSLRIKLGLDPTAPDIHLGHSVVLDRLREFQDAGHTVVLIVGDFTARIGDPSGRSKSRPILSEADIDSAAATYADQAFRVLDPARTELRRNSEWLDMPMTELFSLLRTTTVAQLLERDDFAKRMRDQTPISVLELLYPLVQGFDSVAVKADVELGGSDQTFNLMLARDIQRAFGCPQQVALTMPILVGTDGKQKMSKSFGNAIGLTEDPADIFGKTMSIPDSALAGWRELLFDAPVGENPLADKRQLAASLAERFGGPGAGALAAEGFDAVHRRGGVPKDIDDVVVEGPDVHLPALLAECFSVSRGQARRDIDAGGVRLDGEPVEAGRFDVAATELDGRVLQLGKRRFVRVRIA